MLILTPDVQYSFVGRDDSGSDHLVVRETWVENVYQIFGRDFSDTNTMLDIGANIGAVTVFAASLGADVVAVEPEPENRALLVDNIARNGVSGQCRVFDVAVMGEGGVVNVEAGHGHSRVVGAPNGHTVEVEAVSLAGLLDRAGWSCVDVVKVDVEGAEYQIFGAASSEVLRRIRYLTLEFDATDDETFGAVVSKLACDFGLTVLGSPRRGGYIYARRYD